MRYLTKSRFKLGLECPNKLYFANKKNEYSNIKQENPFLLALASGGFQVEELARLHYPSGILIDDARSHGSYNYEEKVNETSELLKRENVVVFEGAFRFNNLFIRVDIIEKKGNKINLIEVKAKSFKKGDSKKDVRFVGDWKPYLFDVAFQKYVIEKAYPQFHVTPFLMLADKDKTSSIDGLNQLFRVNKNNDKRTGIDVQKADLKGMDINRISVLSLVNITGIVSMIEDNQYKITELDFEESIIRYAIAYEEDAFYDGEINFSACKKCEFKNNEVDSSLKSGFEFCLKKKLNWSDADFKKPNAFEIWDFRSWKKLQEDNNVLLLSDITQEHLGGLNLSDSGMSRTERQWIQIEKSRDIDSEPYVLRDDLKNKIDNWPPPYNFIDFECSTSPLPFFKGQKPYQEVSFQFSHHILHENGRIEHANQFINVVQGEYPNFEFVRSLKSALEKNSGTVFMYSNYENAVLNRRLQEILTSEIDDKDELVEFIKSITLPSKDSTFRWDSKRPMVDLCKVVKDYYYNPHTKGSNSIKKVLPAVFETSFLIRNKYSRSIGEISVSSKNFPENMIWLSLVNGKVKDPYSILDPVTDELNGDLEFLVEGEEIKDGGAAMVAYGMTQYTDMSENEREAIKQSLLKYCELDTLAMVMLFEHLRELTD